MFKPLIELYTKGDVAAISEHILHSTSWRQHDYSAYGPMQISKLWLKSLDQFGFLALHDSRSVSTEKHSALFLELEDEKTKTRLNIALFFEHNQRHIKRLHCTLDTIQLAQLLGITLDELMGKLPSPDPLLLSQFDQQMHPQSYHAKPSDICALPNETTKLMTQWWSIWQEKHLANFAQIYAPNCQISIAGSGTSDGHSSLRQFQLTLHNMLNRSYCQLEHMCFDAEKSTLAILWHIDGDYKHPSNGSNQRVRLPITSYIKFADQRIVEEQIHTDWLAASKAFNIALAADGVSFLSE